MMVAENLGRTLEEIMDMSSLELRLWAAYYGLKRKDQDKAMRKANGGRKHNR